MNTNTLHLNGRKVTCELHVQTSLSEARATVALSFLLSRSFDPIPTSLVKDCSDILVMPTLSIVNLSLSEGCFRSHFKSALFSPL